MRALSIRQPYAELILRGIKTAELPSWETRILGERFYIYAAQKLAGSTSSGRAAGRDLVGRPAGGHATAPLWMIELAEQVKLIG